MKTFHTYNFIKKHNLELLEGKNVQYQLDLSKDIDKKKSDYYCLDETSSYLEFKYAPLYSIKDLKYINLFGDIVNENNILRLVPRVNFQIKDKVSRSSIIFEEPINNEKIDIILIKLKKGPSIDFYIQYGNKIFYEIMNKVSQNRADYSERNMHENEWKAIGILKDRSIQIGTRTKGIENYENYKNYHAKHLGLNDSIELIININEGYLITKVNDRNIRIENKNLMMKSENYLSLVCNHNLLCDELLNKDCSLLNVSLGRATGYVYLEPINIKVAYARIYMMYSGFPVVQYYSESEDKWVDIPNGGKICCSNSLFLRIKMSLGERIYSLLITEV